MDNNSQDNLPEQEKNFAEDEDIIDSTPERHGCVTAWLILMLIANSVIALIYMFTVDKMERVLKASLTSVIMLIIVSILNVIFSVMLLSWKKIAFYCFAATAIIAFVININLGISPGRALVGLAGFAILYGILQIKKDGVSAWEYLK